MILIMHAMNAIWLVTVCMVLFVFGSFTAVQARDVSMGGEIQDAAESDSTSADADQKEVTHKDVIPHKALYNIKMISKSSGARVLNISGQMLFQWKYGCDAWHTDYQFNLLYEYADSPAIRITSNFTTYENFDGKSFNYSSQRKRNGDLFKEIRGHAKMADDGTGTAEYSLPEDVVFDLPEGTIFPIAHTMELIEHLNTNKKFFNRVVFDGSDEEGPVEINVFIGNQVNAISTMKPNKDIDVNLLNAPAWQVRMAFFPLNNRQEEADYEMTLQFHDNGIISDMEVDYDTFSVSQDLVALERLEPEACED